MGVPALNRHPLGGVCNRIRRLPMDKKADPFELNQVTFRYSTAGEPVLKGIDLKVHAGEFVGIVGPTGCGKTTLLYLLTGAIPHYIRGTLEGEVLIFGTRTQELSLAKIIHRVGLVQQDPDSQLFNLLVRDELIWGLENRGFPRDEMVRRLNETLEFFHIEALEQRITYDLSGGEKQRVALAAIYAIHPDVIVFDNPTSQLDPIGSAQVIEAITHVARDLGRTVIMVEDKIDELVKHADRMILMNDGQILLDCEPREFCSHEDTLEAVGVRGPDIVQLSYELQRTGLSLPKIPITVDEAVQMYRDVISAGRAHVPVGTSNPSGHTSDDPHAPIDRGGAVESRDLHPQLGDPPVWNSSVDVPAVRVHSLEYTYPPPRRVVALQGIDLEIPKGGFLAIIGQNGSGKSTLAKCISGFLSPTGGTVTVDGTRIHTLPPPKRATEVGYVFQNPDQQLFRETVWTDVAFGLQNLHKPKDEIETSVEAALKFLELWDKRDLHPFQLSKGDRQRLAIASVVVLKPKVLIVDEPTTGQDPVKAREIMDMLTLLNEEGMTIVVITHSMKLVAEYAKQTVVLSGGTVLLQGSPREIFRHPDTLAHAFLAPPIVAQLALELGLYPLPRTVAEAKQLILEAQAT